MDGGEEDGAPPPVPCELPMGIIDPHDGGQGHGGGKRSAGAISGNSGGGGGVTGNDVRSEAEDEEEEMVLPAKKGRQDEATTAGAGGKDEVEEEAGLLAVGYTIRYNDTRTGVAGSAAARRETVILEIKSGEKHPLRLKNGDSFLESDYDYIKKVKTETGDETGAKCSFMIDKFDLIDGVLDEGTDQQEDAADISEELAKIAEDYPQVRNDARQMEEEEVRAMKGPSL